MCIYVFAACVFAHIRLVMHVHEYYHIGKHSFCGVFLRGQGACFMYLSVYHGPESGLCVPKFDRRYADYTVTACSAYLWAFVLLF